MKPFKNYEETQSYKQRETLPTGGYVLEIKDAKIDEGKNGLSDVMVLSFDIAEGPFKDFYARNYMNQKDEDKKWKGTYRIWLPKDDGSEQDDWTKRRFKTIMENFEESNEGFSWDWDERKLKKLRIGGVFNQKEYDFNGRSGFFTQCKILVSVESIEKGTFKQPADDYLDNRSSMNAEDDDGFAELPSGFKESDLPFA